MMLNYLIFFSIFNNSNKNILFSLKYIITNIFIINIYFIIFIFNTCSIKFKSKNR